MDLIYIRIPENLADNYSWIRVNDGSTQAIRHGTMLDASEDAKGAQVVMLAPSEQILLTSAEIPTKKASVRLKAIPNILDDELASEVEDTHFSIGPVIDDLTPIAAVNKRLIEGWIGLAKAHNLHPRAIVPDVLAVPWHEGSWSILIEENQALVRTGVASGYSCHPAVLDTLLQTSLEQELPAQIRIWLAAGVETELDLPEEQIEITSEDCLAGPLEILSTGWKSKQSIDLQQGEYGLGQNIGLKLKPWRWAAMLLGAFLLLQVVSMFIEQQQLQKQQTDLRAEIEKVFKSNFPRARTTSGMRKRMSDRLTELGETDASAIDMLPILAQSTEVILDKQGAKLEDIAFRSGDLELVVSAGSLSELDTLKDAIAKSTGKQIGFSANSTDGKNLGRIKILGSSE